MLPMSGSELWLVLSVIMFLSCFPLLFVTLLLFFQSVALSLSDNCCAQYKGPPDAKIVKAQLSMQSNVAKEFSVPIWTFHGRLTVTRVVGRGQKPFDLLFCYNCVSSLTRNAFFSVGATCGGAAGPFQ